MTYSRLAQNLSPSAVLAIAGRVRRLVREGEEVQNFTIGDFDPAIFPIPKQLEEDIVTAYREHLTRYPQAEGNEDLRESLCAYAAAFQRLDYTTSEILVASGGRPLIYAMYLALCDPGDKIIYPVPSWNNNYYTELVQGTAVVIETKPGNRFLATAKEIAPHLKGATLLALCSPQNPAGTVYTEEELQKICTLILEENGRRGPGEKKIYVLYDQLYAQLIYGKARHHNPVTVDPKMRPYTVTVDAISKSFAATGLRVGWCFGPQELMEKMKVLLTHMGAWAPNPEQKGLASYLRRRSAVWVFLNEFRDRLQVRLQLLYQGIMNLKEEGYPVDAIAPQAAVFLSLKIDLPSDSGEALFDYLLESGRIALVPFAAFGATAATGWFRVSVGTCTESGIEVLLQSLRRAMDRHHHKLLSNDF